MKQNFFTVQDEKKGYPFFGLSSFYAWIIYLNNPSTKFVRYSIETNQTISKLLNENLIGEHDLELNLQNGYEQLKNFINQRGDKIKVARIYSTLPEYKNKYFFELRAGKITHENDPGVIYEFPIKKFGFKILKSNNNFRNKILVLNLCNFKNETIPINYVQPS